VKTRASDNWDPRQYDKFEREREQPFYDLLSLVRRVPAMRVVDLGCGTGKLTRVLHDRLQARETTGIDRSDRMLAAAGAPETAGLRFEVGTIEDFVAHAGAARPDPIDDAGYDLIFSNAALHWVDEHDPLVHALANRLAPTGQLAFQVPANHDHLSHLVAQEVAASEPFRSALAGWHRIAPVLPPEDYARLLYRCGFREPKVQLIVYSHVLADRDQVVEWVKGTLLTEYARHLPVDLFDSFVDEYRKQLVARLEPAQPFLFPFKRILCWGQRSG
jgi:trans-aconitate 2-methyltransferase